MDTTDKRTQDMFELDFMNELIDAFDNDWDDIPVVDEYPDRILGIRLSNTSKDPSENTDDYTLRQSFVVSEGHYITFMLQSTKGLATVMDKWAENHEISVEVGDRTFVQGGRYTCVPLPGNLYLVTGRINWAGMAGIELLDVGFHVNIGNGQDELICFSSKKSYNFLPGNFAGKVQPLELFLTTRNDKNEPYCRHGFGPDERNFAYMWFSCKNNFSELFSQGLMLEIEFEIRSDKGSLKRQLITKTLFEDEKELVTNTYVNMVDWEDGFYRVDVKVWGHPVCHAFFGLGKRLDGKSLMMPYKRSKNRTVHPSSDVNAIKQIHKMIGLEEVKKHLEQNICYVRMMEARKQAGLPCVNRLMHVVMTGSPGTGKTTVARLLGAAYKEMNILTSGHTVECNRATLVQDHIGGTEKATLDKIEEARGGVLFIDEAYSLFIKRESSNDFGLRIIDTLMTVLSDPESNILVVLAGYADEMDKLLMSNPGLASRFPVRLHFPDYTVDELMLMTESWFTEHRYKANAQVMERIREVIVHAVKEKSFGAGRFVHTFIENTILPNMATRLFARVPTGKYDSKALTRILPQDIPVPEEVLSRIKGPEKKVRSIGFR